MRAESQGTPSAAVVAAVADDLVVIAVVAAVAAAAPPSFVNLMDDLECWEAFVAWAHSDDRSLAAVAGGGVEMIVVVAAAEKHPRTVPKHWVPPWLMRLLLVVGRFEADDPHDDALTPPSCSPPAQP